MTVDSGKREAFKKLAESRTQLALDAIKKLGNLSNKQMYEWEQAEIKKIAVAIREAVVVFEQKFDPKSDGKKVFRL